MWEEIEGTEVSVEAASCNMAFGSVIHLAWLDSHVLLSVSHFVLCQGNRSLRKFSCEDGLPGYCLQEIQHMCRRLYSCFSDMLRLAGKKFKSNFF